MSAELIANAAKVESLRELVAYFNAAKEMDDAVVVKGHTVIGLTEGFTPSDNLTRAVLTAYFKLSGAILDMCPPYFERDPAWRAWQEARQDIAKVRPHGWVHRIVNLMTGQRHATDGHYLGDVEWKVCMDIIAAHYKRQEELDG
jgi:hypothetical protein